MRAARLEVTNLGGELVKLLLGVGVLLRHLLVLGFPLVAGLLESLDFAFEVARLDVGLAEPGKGQQVSTSAEPGGEQAAAMMQECDVLLVQLANGPVRLLSLFL